MIPRFKPWIDHHEITALFRRNRGAVERLEKEFARSFLLIAFVGRIQKYYLKSRRYVQCLF